MKNYELIDNLVEALNLSYEILNRYIKIDGFRYGYDCVSDNYCIDIKINKNYIRLNIKDYDLYNIDYVVDEIVQEVLNGLIEIVKKR